MGILTEWITEWLKELLIEGIMGNLTGLFDTVNTRVGEIAVQVGTTPAAWNAGVFSLIRQISETVILPIAGLILTFVATYELIQMLIDRNNLHDIDTWMFFKWIFKTAAAILILSNTFNIVNAVFDVSQSVIARSAGIIQGSTDITPDMLATLETTLETMELGPLLGLFMQSLLIGLTMEIMGIIIFVLVYRDEKVRAYFLMLEAQGLCVTSYANTTRRFNQEICDFINTIHGDADSMVEPDPNNQQEMPVENSGVYMMNVDSLREYCEYYHPIILRYDKKAKVGFQHDCDVFNYGGSKGATYERVVIIPVSTTLPFIERQVKITSNQTRAKFYVACTRAKHSVVFAMENPCENGVFKATDIHFSDKSIPAYKFSKPDSDI